MIRKKIWNTQAGFSLVELVVVVALIALLAAVAVPTFLDGLPTYRVRSAARDLTANLQKTRMGAVKEGKDWALVFDGANNTYSICSDWGADSDWTTLGDNDVELQPVDLPGYYRSGVGYGGGNSTENAPGTPWGGTPDYNTFPSEVAVYDRSGFLVIGNTAYVYLANQNGDSFAIGAQRSGVIRMMKWGGPDWN